MEEEREDWVKMQFFLKEEGLEICFNPELETKLK